MDKEIHIITILLQLVLLGLVVTAYYYFFKATKHLTDKGKKKKWSIFLLTRWYSSEDYFTSKGLEYRNRAIIVLFFVLLDSWLITFLN